MSNVKVCNGHYSEACLSDCVSGCKVYRCVICGHQKVIHYRGYGKQHSEKGRTFSLPLIRK